MVNNSTFTNNSASLGGGGIFVYNGIGTVNNSTIANNASSDGGGINIYSAGTPDGEQ